MSAVVRLCGGVLLAMCTLAVPTALAASPRAGIWEGTNARGDIVTFDVRPGEGPFQGQPAIFSLQSPGANDTGDHNGRPVRNGRVSEDGLSVRFGTATSASGRVGTPLLPFTARWVSPGRFTTIGGPGRAGGIFETSRGSPVRAVASVNTLTRTLVKLNFGPLLIGAFPPRPDPRFIRGDGRLVGGPIDGVRLSGRLVGNKLYLTVVLPKDVRPDLAAGTSALAAGTYRVTLTRSSGSARGSKRAREQPTDAELLREICKRSPLYPPCKSR